MNQRPLLTEFAKDTLKGLSARAKYLTSKYFYNDKGSRIFQDIMKMPEYYLTDCEIEIFETQKQEILDAFLDNDSQFEVIELGPGDGSKTKILLSHFLNKRIDFKYIPIDISGEAISKLLDSINKELPDLEVIAKTGDYFSLMEEINQYEQTKKVILFLGSNIGNFNGDSTLVFLNKLTAVMHPGDLLFIGFDMKKDPGIIIKAYDDPHGHTAAFNLNLLQRINEELGGNFCLDDFKHLEEYNAGTGTAKSFLVSQKKQLVDIRGLNKTFAFEKGESIFMEMSQKYDIEMITKLAERSGFEIVSNYFDRRHYFVNSLWKLI